MLLFFEIVEHRPAGNRLDRISPTLMSMPTLAYIRSK